MVANISEALGGVPHALIYAYFALAAVQIGLEVWALVDLWRRDRVLLDRKWVWLLLILFVNLIGAIVYLAVGRKVPEEPVADEAAGEPRSQTRAQQAVDVLYPEREDDPS